MGSNTITNCSQFLLPPTWCMQTRRAISRFTKLLLLFVQNVALAKETIVMSVQEFRAFKGVE